MLAVRGINQRSGFCGPAALAMVMDYFGVRETMKELGKRTGCTEEKGVEGRKLVTVAKQYGFEGLIKDRAELADLRLYVKKKEIPVIVDWFSVDDGHYSVVVDVGRKYIYLIDPEIGRIRKLPLATFYRVWFDFPDNFIKSEKDLILRRMVVLFKPKEKKSEDKHDQQ